MQRAIRIWSGVALAVLVLGAAYYLVTSAFMCFDVCPSPDAFPDIALRQVSLAFGPGLLVALVAWGLLLRALAQAGARRELTIAAALPILLVAVLLLALAFIPPTALLPTTAEQYGTWGNKVLLAWLVTLVLVALMLARAPRTAGRVR